MGAPAVDEAMYYPDFGPDTSARDIGDSAILELVGLGGAAAAGSPAVAGFLPGGMADAVAMTEQMASICVAESTRFKLPTWNNPGTPLGVDVRAGCRTGQDPQGDDRDPPLELRCRPDRCRRGHGPGRVFPRRVRARAEAYSDVSGAMERTVDTRWTGGMRAVDHNGGFEIVVDEPETPGGTNTGPQPTDLLLVSIASCLALSIAFVARKRDIELPGLRIRVVGTYEGLKFTRVDLRIVADAPSSVLEDLLPEAQRVCYVTNTLRQATELRFTVS